MIVVAFNCNEYSRIRRRSFSPSDLQILMDGNVRVSGNEVPETKSRCTRGNRVSKPRIGGNWGRSRGAKGGSFWRGEKRLTRVESRMRLEFLARSIESTIEKHERGEGIFFSNLFSTISTNETKKHAFKFNIFVIREYEIWKWENWSSSIVSRLTNV